MKRGVKQGSTRGPYKKLKYDDNGDVIPKYKWKTKEKQKCYLDCVVPNCKHPRYRYDHCWKHQKDMPDKFKLKVPEYHCELCNKKIESKNKSDYQTFCRECYKMMGTQCVYENCKNYTLDFESELCKRHLPYYTCSVDGCTVRAKHGPMFDRYCPKHYKGNKCDHVIENEICGARTGGGNKFCAKHGGQRYYKKYTSDVMTTCQFIMPPRVCNKKIPFVKSKDKFRVLEPTKCREHGGGAMCDLCGKKPACFDQNGMCEDHGGTKCKKCNGPVFVFRIKFLDTCYICIEKEKKEKLNEKRKSAKNTTERVSR